MLDNRTRMLSTTIHKLYQRGAVRNIRRILGKTHMADIAQILETFSKYERFEIFKLLDSKDDRAEVLSYFNTPTQKDILDMLSPDEAKEVVSEMDSDDAADLLGSLPENLSSEILASMDESDSEEVADLMGYPEDSAGGIMSSDYFSIPQEFTVAQTIAEIQKQGEDGLVSFYIYCHQ